MLLTGASESQHFCQTAAMHTGPGGPADWVAWAGVHSPQKHLESGYNPLVLKHLLPFIRPLLLSWGQGLMA